MPLRLIVAMAAALAAPIHATPDAGPLSGARLTQITLPVKDLTRAVGFYRDVLGMRLLFQVKGAAFLDAGGVRLRLEETAKAPSDAVEIYFDDPGLARLKPLADRGVRFVGLPETVDRRGEVEVKLAEFTDPDGNAIGLIGDMHRAPTQ